MHSVDSNSRNLDIVRRRENGETFATIAGIYQISRSRVEQIVKKAKQASQSELLTTDEITLIDTNVMLLILKRYARQLNRANIHTLRDFAHVIQNGCRSQIVSRKCKNTGK